METTASAPAVGAPTSLASPQHRRFAAAAPAGLCAPPSAGARPERCHGAPVDRAPGPSRRRRVPFPVRLLLERCGGGVGILQDNSWAPFLPQAVLQDGWFGKTPSSSEENLAPRDVVVAGRVWALSQDQRGCRLVQHALSAAGSEAERDAVVAELKGHIKEAVRSPHANFVIQKCIELVRPSAVQFVIDEIMEAGPVPCARHKYGCRIVQRLCQHCPPEQVSGLVEALLSDFLSVAPHQYGNYVVQHLLERSPDDRRLRSLVEQHFERLCADAHGCAILRAALTEGQVEDRRRLTKLLLAQPALLSSMKCKRQGEEALRRLRQVLEESDEVPDARGAHASRAA